MFRLGALLIGYICGNFVTAYFVTAHLLHSDPTKVGSGNPGTANVGAVFGKKYGTLTAVGDLAKAVIALAITWLLFKNHLALAYTGLGLMLGHCFPLFYHFKGGKGVAVSIALLLVYDVRIAVAVLLIALVMTALMQNLTIPPLTFMLLFSIFEYPIKAEAGLVFGLIFLVMLVRFWSDVVDFFAGRSKRVDILKTIKRKLGISHEGDIGSSEKKI